MAERVPLRIRILSSGMRSSLAQHRGENEAMTQVGCLAVIATIPLKGKCPTQFHTIFEAHVITEKACWFVDSRGYH
jgi:hypothetical protein